MLNDTHRERCEYMKHITDYKPKDFAELLNVSVKTLQRWDREDILKAKRTPTNRRYYTYDQYLEFKRLIKALEFVDGYIISI